MNINLRAFSLTLSSFVLLAANSPQFDTAQDAIKAQEGCFRVTFQYEEIEGHQPQYVLAPPKRSEVIELVTVDEDTADRIVLQHVLVTPPRIKHWKQIWDFERRTFDTYSALNQWTETTLSDDDVAGQWTQEVRGVADNPRYACSAEWTLADAEWSCETWAAKPRRDKDRLDYNILKRGNTHRIHADGWVHRQRNTKLMVSDGTAVPIVTEVGNNTYDKVDPAECSAALAWWKKRKTTWDPIQEAWDDVSGRYSTYTVHPKVGVAPLWIRLFWLARRPLPEHRHPKVKDRATRIIERHIVESSPKTSALE